jgi:hypothetical protein
MSIEAMKQALDALERYAPQHGNPDDMSESITALRTAIKQTEKQEPVAWINGEGRIERHESSFGRGETIRPLYTTPPASPVQEPRHIVQSNGRHSHLLTHMMNSRTTPPAAQQDLILAEREEVCRIVTGLCISDNNAEEINRAIRARKQA